MLLYILVETIYILDWVESFRSYYWFQKLLASFPTLVIDWLLLMTLPPVNPDPVLQISLDWMAGTESSLNGKKIISLF